MDAGWLLEWGLPSRSTRTELRQRIGESLGTTAGPQKSEASGEGSGRATSAWRDCRAARGEVGHAESQEQVRFLSLRFRRKTRALRDERVVRGRRRSACDNHHRAGSPRNLGRRRNEKTHTVPVKFETRLHTQCRNSCACVLRCPEHANTRRRNV